MWSLFNGKPKKAPNSSSQLSDHLERQDDSSEHRNIARTAPSATASTSTAKRKKHSSGRKEERDTFPDSSSANHDNLDRSTARAAAILSKASSYVTARGHGDDEQVVGGSRGEMSSGRPSRDDTVYSRHESDQKESGTSQRSRRRKSSPTGKRTKDSLDRKERRSRDDVNGDPDITGRGGRRRQDSASKRYDDIGGINGEISRGPGDFSGQIAGTGFTQFPGQYEGAPLGAVSAPPSHHEAASSHVQDQFPGQFPAESTVPYRPPLASTEGGPGLAAEYYGDTGQSVADQPGYRKHSPSLIIGAEPHLKPASSVAAPPTEPSQMGATGAAASFYSGEFQDDTSSTAHTTSKPYTTAPNRPNGTHYTSSAPVVPTLAGATAAAATGYMMSGALSSSQHVSEHGSSISGAHGHSSQPLNQDQTSASQNSFYTPSNRPPRPSNPPSQSSNVPLLAAGAAGAAGLAAASYAHHHSHSSQSVSTSHHHPSTPMQQRHRHQGPFGALVDFVKDPDGVAQFEEYSEIIGVCRGCFEPGSSPRDAPRRHRFYKRRSKERLGSSTRVDKQYRYSSSDDESRRKNGVNWIGAGLAGYGLGKVGETLFNRKNDFDDSSDVKSGRLSPRRRLSPSRRSYDQSLRRRNSSKEDLKRRDSNDALSYRKRDHGGSHAVSAGSAMFKQRPSASGLELKDQSTKTSQSASFGPEPPVTVASVSAEQRKSQDTSPSILRRSSQGEGLIHVDGSRKRRDKRNGRRKEKGFFSFFSPSSNSSASSLELSSRPEKSSRKRRKSSSDRIKNNHEAEAALLGLGAATAALALHNGRPKKGRKDSAHRDSKSRRRTSSASSDDTWESASEMDLSHVDSDLAFGSTSSNASHDSLVSVSPVIAPRRDSFRDEEPGRRASNSNVALPTHSAISVTSDPTGASMTSRDRYDTLPETIDGPMPLQMVYPVPTSDPGRFDVQREDSVASRKPPTTISRPSPVPIQQPQPVVPVSSSFYSSQVPGDKMFNGAEEPNRMSKSSAPVSLHKVSSEPSTSHYEASREGTRRDDGFPHRSLKRRDTSPARLAEEEVPNSMLPSQTGFQKDDSSTVRFAMTKEQEEQDRLERRQRRREERESGERREARRKKSDDRVVKERDVPDLPTKTSNGGSNASWIAPAAGIAGAAVAAAAMSAKSDKEESREERRDRRRREREREDEEEAAAKSERRREKERQRRREDVDEEGADEPNDVFKSKVKPAAKHQQEPAEDVSPLGRHSVWQEAGTPKQTPHEDYQSFFAPAVTDILNKSGEQVKVTSADPDADVSMDKEVAIVEIAPKKRIRAPDEPEFSSADTDEQLDTSRPWPWRVPNLKLVQPTPPVSRASTPYFEPPETIEEEAKEPLEERPTSEAISVDDATHKSVGMTPSAHREDPAVTTTTDADRPRRKIRDYSDSESDGQAQPKSESVGKPDNSVAESPSYGDDYEFAATLAASAEEAGFDPSLVIDNPSYHRRDSPPNAEFREADAGSYDFDATTGTSSEQRRRGKRSRNQTSPMTSIPRNDSAIVDDIVSQVEQPSSDRGLNDDYKIEPDSSLTRETASKAPVEPEEDEPLSKRDRKKKSKRNGLNKTDSVVPAVTPEGTEGIPSLSKLGTSQREVGGRHRKDEFQGIDIEEPVSAVMDDLEEPKRKKKSKRNKVNGEAGHGHFDGSPEVDRSTQSTLAKEPDTNAEIASMDHGSDTVSESFLGMRPEPPPPPDPEPGGDEPPDFEAVQYSESSQGRPSPSEVVISESQQSPGIVTSPTRVPVHFKRPPPINPLPRSSSQSPLSSSRSMSEVVPQTKPRPRSMELKKFPSSKEIRPLWLVERHQSHQEPSPEENYPPLPESHSTSAASSVHNLGESDSEHETDLQQTSTIHLQDSMQAGEQSAPDMFDSQTTTPTAASFAKKADQSERPPPFVNDTPETEQGADLAETPKPRKSLSRNKVVDEMVTAATNLDEHHEENRQSDDSERQMQLVSPESGFAFRDPFVDEHAKDGPEPTPTEENLDTADMKPAGIALDPVISPFDQALITGDESHPVEPGQDAESQREEEASRVGKDPSIERLIDSSVGPPESTQSPVMVNEPISVFQEPDKNDKDDNPQNTAEEKSKEGKKSRSSMAEEPPITILPQQDTATRAREETEENQEASVVDTPAEIPEDDVFGFTTKKKGKKGKKSRQNITERPLDSVPSKEGTTPSFIETSDRPQHQEKETSIPPTTTKGGTPEDISVQPTKKKKNKKGQKSRQVITEEPSEPVLSEDDGTLDTAKTFLTPEQQASENPVPSAPAERPFIAESPQEETILDIGKTPEVQEQQAIETSVEPVTSEALADEDDTFQFLPKKKNKKGKKARQSVNEPQTEYSAPDATTGPIAEELDDQAKTLGERRSLDDLGRSYNIPAPANSKKKAKKDKKQKDRSLDLEGTNISEAPFSNMETNETQEAADPEVVAPEEPTNQPVVHDVVETARSLGGETEEVTHSDAHQNVETDMSLSQMPKITAEARDLTSFAGDNSAELEDRLSPAKIQKSQELMEGIDQNASIEESSRELENLQARDKIEDQPEQVAEVALAASILGKSTDVADLQSAPPGPENIDSREINAALTQQPEHDASQPATASAVESDASQYPAAIGTEQIIPDTDFPMEDLPGPDRNIELGPGIDDAQITEDNNPQDMVTSAPTEFNPSQLPLSPEIGDDIALSAEQNDMRDIQNEDLERAQSASRKYRKEEKEAEKAKAIALDAEFDPVPDPEAPESAEAEAADFAPLTSITKDKDGGQPNRTVSGERPAEAESAETQRLELRPFTTQENEHQKSTEAPSGFPTAGATGVVVNTADLDKSDPNIAVEDLNNDFVSLKTKKDRKKKKKSQASEVARYGDINESEPSLEPSLDSGDAEIVSRELGLEEVASSGPATVSQMESEPVEDFFKSKGKKSKKKSKNIVPFALDDVPEIRAGQDESVPSGEQVSLGQAAARMEDTPAEADLTESKDLEPNEQLQQLGDPPATSEQQEIRSLATEDHNVNEVSSQADGETSSQVYGQKASNVLGMEPPGQLIEHHPADDLLPSYPSETHKDDLDPEPTEATLINEATPAPLEEPAKSPAEIQGFAPVPEVAVLAEGEANNEALPLTTKAAKKDKKKSKKRQAISWNDEPTEPPAEIREEPKSLRSVAEGGTTIEAPLPESVPESTAAADVEAIDKDLSLSKKPTKDKKKAKKRQSLSWNEDLTTESPNEVVAEPSEGPESIRSFIEDKPFTEPRESASDPNTTTSTVNKAVDEALPLTKKTTKDKKKAKKQQSLSWDVEPSTEPTAEGTEVVDEASKSLESTHSAIKIEPTSDLQESVPVLTTSASGDVAVIDDASSSTKKAAKDKKKAKKRQTLSWDEEPTVAPPAEVGEAVEAPQEQDSSRAILENETITERQDSAAGASTPGSPEVGPVDEALPTIKKTKKDKKKAKRRQTLSWDEETTDPPAESTEGSKPFHRDVEFESLRSRSPESEPKVERNQGSSDIPDQEVAASDTVEALAATEPTKVAEPDAEMPKERSSKGASPLRLDPDVRNDVPPTALDELVDESASPLRLDPDVANDVAPTALDELVDESTGQDISREPNHEQGPVNESGDIGLAPLKIQSPSDEKDSTRSQDSAFAEQILEQEEPSVVEDRLPLDSHVPESVQLPPEDLRKDDQITRADEAGVPEDLGRALGATRSDNGLGESSEQEPPGRDIFEDDRIPSKERVQAFTDNILASQAAETGDVRETGLAAPAIMEEPSEAPAEQSRISGPPTPLSAGSADLLNVEEQREYDEQYARELERQLQGQMPDQILGQETQGPEAHQSAYEASMPVESSPHGPRETLAKATSLEDIVEEPLSKSMSQPEKPETQGTQGTQGLPFQPTRRSKKGKKGKNSQQPVIWEDETATAGISPEPEPAVGDPDIDERPLDLEENIEAGQTYLTQAASPIAISPSAARKSSKAEGDNGDYFGIQPSHRAEEDIGATGDGDRRHSLSVEPAQIVEERNEPGTDPRGIPEETPADQGVFDDGAPLPSKKSKKGKKSRRVSEFEEKDDEDVGKGDGSQSLATQPSQLTQEPEALVAESQDVPPEVPNEQEAGNEWQPLPSKKGKKSKKSRKAFQADEDEVAGTVGEEPSQVLPTGPAQSVHESMFSSRDVQADLPNDPPADNREPLRTKKSKKGKKSGDALIAEFVEEMPETAQPQPRDNGQDDLDGIVPISRDIARSTEATGDGQMEATKERSDDAWEPLPTKKDKKGKKSRKASKAEAEVPKVDKMEEIERPQEYGDAPEDLNAQGTTAPREETDSNEALLGAQIVPADKQEEADDWTPLPAKKGKKGKKSRNASKAEIGLPKVDETLEAERAEQYDGRSESDAPVSTPQKPAETYGGVGDVAASTSLGAAAMAAEALSRNMSKEDKKGKEGKEDAAPVEDDVTVSRDLEMTEQPPSNEDLTQMDDQQIDSTSERHAESAPLPESVQAERTQQSASIDVDEQRQRDSAIHVQMSPSLPEDSVYRVERDSGYPATEPSPILREQQESKEEPTERDIIESYANQPESPQTDIEQEWAPSETNWPVKEEGDSKAGFTERHMSDSYNEKSELPLEDNEADLIESYGEAPEDKHSDPLIATQGGQAETKKAHPEALERSSTPPNQTPGVNPKRRNSRRASQAGYDSDDSADSGFDVQRRRRRIQALAEEAREPSPVSSTTKDRSSALFDSSPSGREGFMKQLRDRSPVDAQPSAASPRDDQTQHEHMATTGEPVLSFGNIEGARTHEGASLFGGQTRPEDSVSESRSPVQAVERGRQGLRRVSERSIEQSPGSPLSRKDKRDVSDIGTPEQGVKSRRKSRKFPKRDGTPSRGGEELRSQPSLQASEDRASSIGFQESIGRNTDRVPSRLSNISGARSLRSPGIGSPDSIHAIIRTPEQVRSASGQSIRSSGTPPLRRVDRSISGDLRAASRKNEAKIDTKPKIAEEAEPEEAGIRHQLSRQQLPQQLHQDQDSDEDIPIASSSVYDPVKDKGKTRADPDMADYEGFGAIRGQSPMSPTRPPSMRKRQSMHFAEMEQRLAMLASENSLLQNAKSKAEKRLDEQARDHSQQRESYEDAIKDHKAYISDRDHTLNELNHILDGLRQQVAHLTSANAELVHAREEDDRPPRLAWERTTRELADLRVQHSKLTTEHEGIVSREIHAIREKKDSELHQLREELEDAKSQIRKLQQQILSSRSTDDIVEHDEDYFDAQCQELCRHLTSWVTRFSKLSDNQRSFLAAEIRNGAHQALFEDCMLDGSEVDDYLQDRHRRRDVFMAVTMALIFKHVFARYLFGMDREHRQKLKSLDKTLQEVGPPAAVHKWRATTLNLLSKRPTFQREREQEADAVVEDIWSTLSSALPPPSTSTQTAQCRESLHRIINLAVDLSIDMRLQRAEYSMLPPPEPEFDPKTGEIINRLSFTAVSMNERSGAANSNEELEEAGATLRMVLFPLVVKNMVAEEGEEEEQIVVCPAQVHVTPLKKSGRGAGKTVRVMSAQGGRSEASYSVGDDDGDTRMEGGMF